MIRVSSKGMAYHASNQRRTPRRRIVLTLTSIGVLFFAIGSILSWSQRRSAQKPVAESFSDEDEFEKSLMADYFELDGGGRLFGKHGLHVNEDLNEEERKARKEVRQRLKKKALSRLPLPEVLHLSRKEYAASTLKPLIKTSDYSQLRKFDFEIEDYIVEADDTSTTFLFT